MSRGRCTFRQQDVARALRAAFAAGATRAEVKIGVGSFEIVAEKKPGGESISAAATNEWDIPPARKPTQ
jgi:hypothetical protein